MSRYGTNLWERRTDRYTVLLASFFIVLLTLFVYLYKGDREITAYDRCRYKLGTLRVLDYRLESFLSKKYRYIDYDEATNIEREIDNVLQSLNLKKVDNFFGQEVVAVIKSIIKEYRKKIVLFEDYKTLNAQITNALYSIYDYKQTISATIDDLSSKKIVDEVFFGLSHIVMDIPIDEKSILNRLRRLEHLTKRYPVVANFILQVRVFLNESKQMSALDRKIRAIPLLQSLDKALDVLNEHYHSTRQTQKTVVMFLIMFAFVLMGWLIYAYRRIRHNTLQLQAFRYAIAKSDNAVVLTDTNLKIEYVNEAFERQSGYSQTEVFGNDLCFMHLKDVSRDVTEDLYATIRRGQAWQGEVTSRRKDGSILYEKVSIVPIYIGDILVQFLAIKLDITAYKVQQQRLKQAAAVYDLMGDGIVITDAKKRIVSVNPAFVHLFGYQADELVGQEMVTIQARHNGDRLYDEIWEELMLDGRWAGKVSMRTKSGETLPVWLTLTVVRNEDGEIENYIGIFTNLKEIIASQERAEYLAYHDSLTDLPNRAYLDMKLDAMLRSAMKKGFRLAIIFIDLDRFKMFNDTLGHTVGDAMLVQLAKRLKSMVDEDTLLARMGGDEFVIVMPVAEEGNAAIVATVEKVLDTIRRPFIVNDYRLTTTASIGITVFPDDTTDKNELFKFADSAMYAAKEQGKDRFAFYDKKLSKSVERRLAVEQALKDAIGKGGISLHYQPQYRLHDKKVVAVEALVRWRHEILGDISPEEFIGVAEDTGLIIPLGYEVFQKACRAFVRWKQAGLSLERIAVNVSILQFRDDNFVETIRTIMQDCGIAADEVEIEITERIMVENRTSNLNILEALRKLGCHISIDDFGTGYSSMSYMKRLPIDTIKIDKSFIDDLPDDPNDREVTKAIVALAKSLGYGVVAEGIETKEQEAFLLSLGCDYGQGFYFAKPMSEEKLAEFLDSYGS